MHELKRLDIWSVIKVTFILAFFLGLVFGFLYFLFMIFMTQFASVLGGEFESEIVHFSGFVGFFMIFFIAILTAVIYTIGSAIMAFLYNLVSGWVGGIRIKMTVEEVEKGTTVE